MGINGLFPFLKYYHKNVNLTQYSGKTAAIDASCWIHKALVLSFSETGNRSRCAETFEKHLSVVVRAGVIPFVVFDGLPLPAKTNEVEKRQRERNEYLKKAESEGISVNEANKFRAQAASILFEDVTTCVNICLSKNISYVVSPYESDAQITFLLENKLADFAITEDSDLLIYGCKEVIVKLHLSGDGDHFELTNILAGLNVTFKQFQSMCVLAGCDYLKNIRGVGIHTAYKIVCANQDLYQTLKGRGAPASYMDGYNKTMAVFNHQTVFDLNLKNTAPLHKWEIDVSMDLLMQCGELLDTTFSNELAVGNINTKTLAKVSYNLPTNKVSNITNGETNETCTTTNATCAATNAKTNETCSAANESQRQGRIDVHITSTEKRSFPYVIPHFPVMAVDLIKVEFHIDGNILNGVIDARKHPNLRLGVYACTSYCDIIIEGEKYVVLWELSCYKPFAINNTSSDHDSDDENVHCLPFKVVGTCYSPSRQKALESAYDYMHTYNRPVFAKLVAEPENPTDRNAIAVYVMSDEYEDHEKVGYIPKELTTFLHGPLKASKLDVSVKDVRFRTTYLLIGFYITLNISKRGAWDVFVVRASLKVD